MSGKLGMPRFNRMPSSPLWYRIWWWIPKLTLAMNGGKGDCSIKVNWFYHVSIHAFHFSLRIYMNLPWGAIMGIFGPSRELLEWYTGSVRGRILKTLWCSVRFVNVIRQKPWVPLGCFSYYLSHASKVWYIYGFYWRASKGTREGHYLCGGW